MKTTDFITENLAMAAQEAQADHEVDMARAQCYNAAQYAVEIHKLLKNVSEIQGIEGWVASKLTLAEDYLNTVRDYLRYEATKQDELEQFSSESATALLDSALNKVEENATSGATGSAAVATTPGVGKGKTVGTLFGGSYKQSKKK